MNKINVKAIIEFTTDFTDEISDESTAIYLLEEDLADIGYVDVKVHLIKEQGNEQD